jgi:hypothetical protein
MFVAGVEWGSPLSLIYVQERPKNAEGLWTPDDALIWILNVEVGYFFFEKKNPYVSLLFSLSFPRFGIFDP